MLVASEVGNRLNLVKVEEECVSRYNPWLEGGFVEYARRCIEHQFQLSPESRAIGEGAMNNPCL